MNIIALLLSFLLATTSCAAVRFVPPKKPSIVKINFEGPVNEVAAGLMGTAFEMIEKTRPAAVLLVINSTGGDVDSGWKMIRMIQSAKMPIHCLVDGEADSMAFYMLQACTTRGMTSVSKIMTHQPYFKMAKDTALTMAELRSLTHQLQTIIDQVEILSAARLGMPLADFRKANEVDWWMSSISGPKAKAVDYVVSDASAVQKSLEMTGKLP